MIGEEAEQYGVLSIHEAMNLATQQGLDLVEVSPTAKPPVCKLIDYGKYKYMAQKKATEAKKKQVVIDIKEIQLRPNIEKHDLEVKLKRIEGFLKDGDKVKLVMQFRGREMTYQVQGLEKFKGIVGHIVESFGGALESEPKIMGNRIISMIAGVAKKA